jgi:hypothetical protein
MPRLSIGDLITDSYGRECLVVAKERRPDARWIAQQEDVRMRQAAGAWWKAIPLDGGAVIVADELGTFLRRATVDDVVRVLQVQQTDHAATVTLVDLFDRLRSAAKAASGAKLPKRTGAAPSDPETGTRE